MKKSYLLIASLLSLVVGSQPVFASTPNQQFNTIAQAQQFCSPPTRLFFVPSNPSPNSAGFVVGSINDMTFKSSQTVMAPQSKNSRGLINNANFRNVNGMYGYISNNTVTCLYSYPGFTGIQVNLILRYQSTEGHKFT